jgi:predicted lipid-binding transport protein (Tim44 family)
MQRSFTPSTSSRGYGNSSPAYSYGTRSGFTSGLVGGLIGAGLAGLLLGHGFWGGMMGFGGFLGFLLQILLLVFLVHFLVRLFRGPLPIFSGAGPGISARTGPTGLGLTGAGGDAAQPPIALGPPLPGVRAVASGYPGRLERP